MNPRPRNYCSFYVKAPFFEYKVGATSTPDYCYYNLLKTWRRNDRTFNYYDAHCLSYFLREKGRDYYTEILPAIHDRLDHSKNMILILTENTQISELMNVETDYAINVKGMPIVVVYPDLEIDQIFDSEGNCSETVQKLWEAAPLFRDNQSKVYVQHVPFDKSAIHEANNKVDDYIDYMKESLFDGAH